MAVLEFIDYEGIRTKEAELEKKASKKPAPQPGGKS
jgi:hypothetical protein